MVLGWRRARAPRRARPAPAMGEQAVCAAEEIVGLAWVEDLLHRHGVVELALDAASEER